MLRIVLAALAGVTLALTATWCTTGSRARRVIGVMLGVAVMLPPWILPEQHSLLRATWTLVAFTTTMRVSDLTRMTWKLPRRLLHVLSVIDSRRLVRVAPRFEIGALARLLAWIVVIALVIASLLRLEPSDRIVISIARWSLGVVGVYAAVSSIYAWLIFSYAAIGFKTPPLHQAPIFSRTVSELWGKRWARPISDWLNETFFRPWARRGRARTGIMLAFIVSASFHAYAIWVGLGFSKGLTMAALTFIYFVAQAGVMGVERIARVARWPAWAGHLWTVAWMLALAPLFVEPALRVLSLTQCG